MDVFSALPEIDVDTATRLHTRLVASAAAGGLLDLAYRTVDSPIGTLLLAATPLGLVRVAFSCENHEQVLAALGERISPRILRAPGRLDAAASQLEEYFAGTRTRFELPLDLRLATGFRREVLAHLPDVGYGATASYSALALLAGSPRAVRAVGTACARNPLPVVLPCHRIVRSDGSAGSYLGGTEAKLTLLNLEAA